MVGSSLDGLLGGWMFRLLVARLVILVFGCLFGLLVRWLVSRMVVRSIEYLVGLLSFFN